MTDVTGLSDARPPADAPVIGRRGILGAAVLGAAAGMSSVRLAQAQSAPAAPKGPQPLNFPGKDAGLSVLGERPLVAETPEHLLDDDTTPIAKFFIRHNGTPPDETKDADSWTMTIDGEVERPLKITLGELKKRFKPVTRRMVMECGGNGRSFFTPQARGNQWTNGGIGCAEWTGVKLSDVLKAVGVKKSATFSGHYGADKSLADNSRDALSRGVPIKKLMDENNLIVFAMNGQPLPHVHGGPVRLIVPGWPGSVSAKWFTRLWVRDKTHDGPGMGSTSYRVAIKPMIPGGKPDEANFKDLESMPVRSIITSPANGTKLAANTRELKLRGAAWAGDREVREVTVSVDYGATWQKAKLDKPKNKYDWQRWTAAVKVPSEGYYEIWSRATDTAGVAQPHIAGNWNPQGYGANPLHRIAVLLG